MQCDRCGYETIESKSRCVRCGQLLACKNGCGGCGLCHVGGYKKIDFLGGLIYNRAKDKKES